MTGRMSWSPPRGGLTAENVHLYYTVQGDCWICRSKPECTGYTRVSFRGKRAMAHRAAYEALVGPIPVGLHVDHLCFVRNCMNPAHLEPVTAAENQHRMAMRKTHCVRGHLFDDDNTHVRVDGTSRTCRACDRLHRRRYRMQKRFALWADVAVAS